MEPSGDFRQLRSRVPPMVAPALATPVTENKNSAVYCGIFGEFFMRERRGSYTSWVNSFSRLQRGFQPQCHWNNICPNCLSQIFALRPLPYCCPNQKFGHIFVICYSIGSQIPYFLAVHSMIPLPKFIHKLIDFPG